MGIDRIPGVGPTNADIATAVAAPSAATIAAAVAAPSAATIAAAVAAPSAATIASTVAGSVPTLSQINTSVANNASPFGGTWTTVSHVNFGANPAQTVTISSLSGYKYLRVFSTAYVGSADWSTLIRFNGDTSNNYTNLAYRGSAGTSTINYYGSFAFNTNSIKLTNGNHAAGNPAMIDFEIRNSNSGSYKILSMLNFGGNVGGQQMQYSGFGIWNQATAIDSLTFLTASSAQFNGGYLIVLGAN